MDYGCPDCFKEVRSRNDMLRQIQIDAKKYANENQAKVAIIQEGSGFRIEAFEESIPEGTIDIVIPG